MTHEEIVRLGALVNIEVTLVESRELIPNMESILGYIDQIQKVEISLEKDLSPKENPILREDVAINKNFGSDFIVLAGEKENGYVKVPQVLDK